jgi:hypothetical protein
MTKKSTRADSLAARSRADAAGPVAEQPTAEPSIVKQTNDSPAAGSRPLRRWSVGELIARALAARPAEGRG